MIEKSCLVEIVAASIDSREPRFMVSLLPGYHIFYLIFYMYL